MISVAEYLSTSYSPDREYRDGVLVERNAANYPHSIIQGLIIGYLLRRRKQWKINVCPELRIKVRENWYPIPDICIYGEPGPTETVPSYPPLLWIEILSPDDRMVDVRNKATELIANNVPYVWIIDPTTLESELRSATGIVPVPGKVLRLPNSPIVIDLPAAIEE